MDTTSNKWKGIGCIEEIEKKDKMQLGINWMKQSEQEQFEQEQFEAKNKLQQIKQLQIEQE